MLNLRTGSWGRYLMCAVGALLLVVPATASASGVPTLSPNVSTPLDDLLAPESACPGETDLSAPRAAAAETMVCLHNYARAQSGLPPLHVDKELKASSLRKARDIKHCQQFSHNACGRDAFYWVRKVGFLRGPAGAGENLALGTGTVAEPRETMQNWLNSPLHRSVLLTPSFDEVGISVVSGKVRGLSGTAAIWVAHFGYRH